MSDAPAPLLAAGGPDREISAAELAGRLDAVAARLVADRVRRVLIVPPDHPPALARRRDRRPPRPRAARGGGRGRPDARARDAPAARRRGDPVGAGDAFAARFVLALADGASLADAVAAATRANVQY